MYYIYNTAEEEACVEVLGSLYGNSGVVEGIRYARGWPVFRPGRRSFE
jgi:hypothetical protein